MFLKVALVIMRIIRNQADVVVVSLSCRVKPRLFRPPIYTVTIIVQEDPSVVELSVMRKLHPLSSLTPLQIMPSPESSSPFSEYEVILPDLSFQGQKVGEVHRITYPDGRTKIIFIADPYYHLRIEVLHQFAPKTVGHSM